jgi:glycosyltransferase involved in cell wall biosynthesis
MKIGVNIQVDNSSVGTARLQEAVFENWLPFTEISGKNQLEIYAFCFGYRFSRPKHLPLCIKYKKSILPGKIQRLANQSWHIPIEKILGLPKLDAILDLRMDNFQSGAPVISYIPDIAWKYYGPGEYEKVFPLKCIRRAEKSIESSAKIITLSKWSKAEIGRFFPGTLSKIDVIYCGVDSDFQPELDCKHLIQIPELIIPKSYFLMMGSINARKNPRILGDALKKIGPGFNMVHVGSAPCEGYAFWNLDFPEIFPVGFVPKNVLASLLKNAKFLIIPSTCEGFGIPLIEGMASKVPVLCSDIPVFREISQNTVKYFKPNCPIDLANQIFDIWNFPDPEMVSKAFLRSKEFNWKIAADSYLNILKSV